MKATEYDENASKSYITTTVKCSCGKEFKVKNEYGVALAFVEHDFEVMLLKIWLRLTHFMLKGHHKSMVYCEFS